jgi:hypothetical protein
MTPRSTEADMRLKVYEVLDLEGYEKARSQPCISRCPTLYIHILVLIGKMRSARTGRKRVHGRQIDLIDRMTAPELGRNRCRKTGHA